MVDVELEGLTGVCEGEVPKSRRVDENRRDGSLRLEEYWQDTEIRSMKMRLIDTYSLVPFHDTFLHPRNQAHGHEFSRESRSLLDVLFGHPHSIQWDRL